MQGSQRPCGVSVRRFVLLAWAGAIVAGLAGCVFTAPQRVTGFENTTDKTNAGASYAGSTACTLCHTDIAAKVAIHGHSNALTSVRGLPPTFPAAAPRAGVPAPPSGFSWSDIAFVVGGYTKDALFVGNDGFLLTTGASGVDTQWNLAFAPNGTEPSFAPYLPDQPAPQPFEAACFVCHTTGAMAQNSANPMFQENRPGILGTWREEGVRCEACHGPGGNHFTTRAAEVLIRRDRIFINSSGSQTCVNCHTRPFGSSSGDILAADGFIQGYQQAAELRASGSHSAFACTVCHDPHASATYDRDRGIRNDCTVCHDQQNMARHEGKVYVAANGYTETLRCESCHMPFATRTGSSTLIDSVDFDGTVQGTARVGDTRSHIFRISFELADFNDMLSDDGSRVRLDDRGRAAVTVDFVCMRCHNGQGNVFGLSVESASEIATLIHTPR